MGTRKVKFNPGASKGGLKISQNKEHMAAIGRKGGLKTSQDREHMSRISKLRRVEKPEEIKMGPGRELDALIAERVMDFLKRPDGYYKGPDWFYSLEPEYGNMNGPKLIPSYSTSIEAAWEVVKRMLSKNNIFQLKKIGVDWEADFAPHNDYGDTAPHAICLAALKAVEGK